MVRRDIAARQADALVNAAGTSLQMGSGVAGALRRNAGGPIHDAAVSKSPVDLGAVAVGSVDDDFDADCVIRAAAMRTTGTATGRPGPSAAIADRLRSRNE